jgi:hypothetical protein
MRGIFCWGNEKGRPYPRPANLVDIYVLCIKVYSHKGVSASRISVEKTILVGLAVLESGNLL